MAQKGVQNKRVGFEILRKRQQIAELYLKGMTQVAIAAAMKLNPETVRLHLNKIRELWLFETVADYNERKAKEIAKLDYIEENAWKGWERSCADATIRREELTLKPSVKFVKGKKQVGTGKLRVSKRTEEIKGQTGDPRFLEIVARCVELRMKTLGMFKEANTTNIGQMVIQWNDLISQDAAPAPDPVEERFKMLESVQAPEPTNTGTGTVSQPEPEPEGPTISHSDNG